MNLQIYERQANRGMYDLCNNESRKCTWTGGSLINSSNVPANEFLIVSAR